MIRSKADRIIARYQQLEAEKQPWLANYQRLGEYVNYRKQNFTSEIQQGQFVTDKISDSTAAKFAHTACASILGALWPNGEKTFVIDAPDHMDREVAESKEVKNFYTQITKKMRSAIGNPKAGFLTSLEEYFLDQVVFGTSGISVMPTGDRRRPCRFTAVDVKRMCIAENDEGFVDTIYIKRSVTVRQLVQEYGYPNVSSEVRTKYDGTGVDDKVEVLQAIEPRLERNVGGAFGNADMPIASLHIEMQTKKILKESGFWEVPIAVTRFWKENGCVYGRSPAMDAIPDILEINALRDAVIVATEKLLDPPLAVYDDGGVGNGEIRTGARDINVFRVSGRLNGNQRYIEPINTVGELKSTYERINTLEEIIANWFFSDRLMDLNNETRMTLGEAQIRNELRGQSLNTIYSRQILELFTPVLERVFNILFEMGELGVMSGSEEEARILEEGGVPLIIPNAVLDTMVNGKDVYKITFISPAARIMRLEELMGVQRTVQFAVETAAQTQQLEILDNLDLDAVMRQMQDLTGAPSNIIRAADDVQELRAMRAEQQAQAQQLQMQQVATEIQRDGAKAALDGAKAQGLVR